MSGNSTVIELVLLTICNMKESKNSSDVFQKKWSNTPRI